MLRSLFFLAILLAGANSAKILCYFADPGKSHVILAVPIVEELARRGHQVTVVDNHNFGFKDPKIREIYVEPKGFGEEIMERLLSGNAGMSLGFMFEAIEQFKDSMLLTMKSPAVQKLLDEEFDLVFFINFFFNDHQLGLADHFKAPYVTMTPMGSVYPTRSLLGTHGFLSTVPSKMTGFPSKMTFVQRVINFGVAMIEFGMTKYFECMEARVYEELWSSDRYRSIWEMKKNASAVFMNGHWTDSGIIRPTLPNEVDIGGIQIRKNPKPLEADVKKFLDEAKEGVIVWTFGSNIPISVVNPEKIAIMFKALGARKEKVILRWDSEDISKLPANFMGRKWLAQDSILAHKNVKLFITHGGHGGSMEALYHEVPIFGIPFFGDQETNVAKAEVDGWGRGMKLNEINQEDFSKVLSDLLTNTKYRTNVKRLSEMYRDRLNGPLESAVFWIEYVLKYNGAPHVTYSGRNLNFFQMYSLDVIAAILIVLYVLYRVLKAVLKFIFRAVFGRFLSKPKPSKKQKKN